MPTTAEILVEVRTLEANAVATRDAICRGQPILAREAATAREASRRRLERMIREVWGEK